MAEAEAFSFRPQINHVSRMIGRQGYNKAEDFLIQYGRAVKDKIDSQRVYALRKELDGLSFQPKISKVSQKMHQQKLAASVRSGNTISKYESLYEDALRRRER